MELQKECDTNIIDFERSTDQRNPPEPSPIESEKLPEMKPIDLVKQRDVTFIEQMRSIDYRISIDHCKSSEGAVLESQSIS
jgi:hypothetical protein